MVASSGVLTIVPYERRYRADTLDLIDYSYQRHVHLDWYEPAEWIDAVGSITRLAFRGTHLVGMMAATSPLLATSWIKLVAVADGAPETEVLERLWEPMTAALREAGAETCWVLMLEPWFEYYMPTLNMTEAVRLITLRREGPEQPALDAPGVSIEPATLEDVAAMAAIDQAAFEAPFQMTAQEMRRAYRFAALSSVARIDGRVAGYQLSTRHGDQGHLARLAVSPSAQGTGIGALLVRDMTAAFIRRGVEFITVNTQVTNDRSLNLYASCGFTRSGYDIPVFNTRL